MDVIKTFEVEQSLCLYLLHSRAQNLTHRGAPFCPLTSLLETSSQIGSQRCVQIWEWGMDPGGTWVGWGYSLQTRNSMRARPPMWQDSPPHPRPQTHSGHPQLGDRFISGGCHKKLPPVEWLKTTEVYFLAVLETRSLK